MDRLDQLWVREAQLVERAVREDVVPVDLGAHRAVEDEHAAGEGVGESGSVLRHGEFFGRRKKWAAAGLRLVDMLDGAAATGR